jgi:murein DD-endopeptidase MepM/ murein hydrolase activator NlpD
LAEQITVVQNLESDRAAMDAVFAEQQSLRDEQAALVAALDADRAEILALVGSLEERLRLEELAAAREAARLAAIEAARQAAEAAGLQVLPEGTTGPFDACPVDEPRAYGDGFGAPRYGGGYHPHAGNDIIAPMGTPIRATFDGVAEAVPNALGGMAVIVRGAEGYTYNAHFSRYGTLGAVTAGTIIGYVGDSGNAKGGPPHNHFEWHPKAMPARPWVSPYGYRVIEDAVDPYPYLNLVC